MTAGEMIHPTIVLNRASSHSSGDYRSMLFMSIDGLRTIVVRSGQASLEYRSDLGLVPAQGWLCS